MTCPMPILLAHTSRIRTLNRHSSPRNLVIRPNSDQTPLSLGHFCSVHGRDVSGPWTCPASVPKHSSSCVLSCGLLAALASTWQRDVTGDKYPKRWLARHVPDQEAFSTHRRPHRNGLVRLFLDSSIVPVPSVHMPCTRRVKPIGLDCLNRHQHLDESHKQAFMIPVAPCGWSASAMLNS